MRLALFVVSLLLPSAVLAADWRQVSENIGWEYDASTIRRSPAGVIVWFKYRLIPAGLDELRKGHPDKDFTRYDYSLARYELGCRGRTMKLLAATEYDSDGAPIVSTDTSALRLQPTEVLPDSVMDTALSQVCARASRSK